MNDTPTPKTDRIMENILIAIDADNTGQSSQHREEARREIEQIERELAEARGQISDMEIRHAATMFHTQSVVDDAIKLREQRDRLAEAFESIICDSDCDCHTCQVAREVLAAVKGEQP